jgi:hypothetical protein
MEFTVDSSKRNAILAGQTSNHYAQAAWDMLTSYLFWLLFDPEDEGSEFFRNVSEQCYIPMAELFSSQ